MQLQECHISAAGQLKVVGESKYQDALCRAAGRRVAGAAIDEMLPADARLVAEPENPWDGNAVRVDTRTPAGFETIGYIGRYDAPHYQRVLLTLQARGHVGACPGRITGGGTKLYGMFLNVGPPDDLIIENWAPGPDLLAPEHLVGVTRSTTRQEVLAAFSPLPGRLLSPIVAGLDICVITKGKHAGVRAIDTILNGQRAGKMTETMSRRYLPQVVSTDGRRTRCEAIVTRAAEGLRLHLQLPHAALEVTV